MRARVAINEDKEVQAFIQKSLAGQTLIDDDRCSILLAKSIHEKNNSIQDTQSLNIAITASIGEGTYDRTILYKFFDWITKK